MSEQAYKDAAYYGAEVDESEKAEALAALYSEEND